MSNFMFAKMVFRASLNICEVQSFSFLVMKSGLGWIFLFAKQHKTTLIAQTLLLVAPTYTVCNTLFEWICLEFLGTTVEGQELFIVVNCNFMQSKTMGVVIWAWSKDAVLVHP